MFMFFLEDKLCILQCIHTNELVTSHSRRRSKLQGAFSRILWKPRMPIEKALESSLDQALFMCDSGWAALAVAVVRTTPPAWVTRARTAAIIRCAD